MGGQEAKKDDTAAAVQLLRARQNAYYIQAVQEALQAEERRKQRLETVASPQEGRRLEKQFARERRSDRERLHHIQEDHALLLNAKIEQWKAQGGVPVDADVPQQRQRQRQPTRKDKVKKKATFSTKTVERLAAARAPTAEEQRPTSASSTSANVSSRGHAETSQELAFYKDVYTKQDRARLSRGSSRTTLSAASLQTMSEMELLRRQEKLLTELHGVVALEQRIVQDDQCTVRSSVSSWKSSDAAPPR